MWEGQLHLNAEHYFHSFARGAGLKFWVESDVGERWS